MSEKLIPFFDYPSIFKRYESEFVNIFCDVGTRGAYILQKDLAEFEENLARFLGVKHAVGVADGTNALIVGLQSCGIADGDEVIIASHTYVATAAAIKSCGATPILADIGHDNLICPKSVEQKITDKTKAIMPTQLNGRCSNMDRICSLASEYGLDVFEDSAQALGAKFKGKNAGTFGRFGTFSFYPAKVLGCFGDGGAIVTNDHETAAKIRLLRDHGRNENGEVVDWGTNNRLDNLQAAFLNFRLKNYHEDMKHRRDVASIYDLAFRGHPSIYPPCGPSDGDHYDVYQNYEMAAENRNELIQYLDSFNIKSIVQWAGTPLHQFESLGFENENHLELQRTNWFFERCLMLPLNMSVTLDDARVVAKKVLDFYS